MRLSEFILFYRAFICYISEVSPNHIAEDGLLTYWDNIVPDFLYYLQIIEDFYGAQQDEPMAEKYTDRSVIVHANEDNYKFDIVDGEFLD